MAVLRIFYLNPLQNQLVPAMVGYGYLWLFFRNWKMRLFLVFGA